MKQILLAVLISFALIATANAQMPQKKDQMQGKMDHGTMIGEGQQMKMCPCPMMKQKIGEGQPMMRHMMGQGMMMRDMMHMMRDMMKMQKRMLSEMTPAERKEMMKEMDRMMDRMDRMMSDMMGMMMKGVVEPAPPEKEEAPAPAQPHRH